MSSTNNSIGEMVVKLKEARERRLQRDIAAHKNFLKFIIDSTRNKSYYISDNKERK